MDDGQTIQFSRNFANFGQTVNDCATVPAPATIAELADALQDISGTSTTYGPVNVPG